MRIPKIKGVIERRILINYQVDKKVLLDYLPEPFKPKLVNGKGIAGICLIRLKEIRPKGFPKQVGISSENGAHRIAVEWIENGETKEGVYISRRDTSSKINSLAGGSIFPGIHHLAEFNVKESDGHYDISFRDDNTVLSVRAVETAEWNNDSVFESLECASRFFESGGVGFSLKKNNKGFDGLELKTYNWKVSLLEVEDVQSSFFQNQDIFPEGSVKFDNALLMRNIEHEWIGLDKIKPHKFT
ncbi:MAG: DUF2071 domain-containing protein [Bacteroidota bacterium]